MGYNRYDTDYHHYVTGYQNALPSVGYTFTIDMIRVTISGSQVPTLPVTMSGLLRCGLASVRIAALRVTTLPVIVSGLLSYGLLLACYGLSSVRVSRLRVFDVTGYFE